MADMEQMVLSEKSMLVALKQYILAEEEKLKKVKKFMSRVNDALQYVNETDAGKYLGNPVNSYLMLKRFNVDWKQLETTLEADVADDFNAVYEKMKPFFPTPEDHQGAMDALFRLQTTYKLSSNSLAQGIIPGVTESEHSLNIQEIYELGQHAYYNKNWRYATEWFQTALNEIGERDWLLDVERADIIDHLAYAYFQNGEVRKAYKLTKILAQLRPNITRIQNNLYYFHNELKDLDESKRGDTGEIPNDEGPENENSIATEARKVQMEEYEKLCRGETRALTRKEQSKLKCWYKWKDPVLRLKPQKVDRIWAYPEVRVFRGILSEAQVEWIKATSYPLLQRATIQDPITNKLRYADYRVSKSAWLPPADYPYLQGLKLRVQAATGLDMNSAEHLQIANYGLGGHYEPHFDHARDEEDKFTDLGMGNRIATILFYMSDVKAGGATVFTRAKAAIFPSKSDAAFWFNLKRNGESNDMTRHAACPVLVGQKWVSNWWIHEYGQVFRRRCALNKNY